MAFLTAACAGGAGDARCTGPRCADAVTNFRDVGPAPDAATDAAGDLIGDSIDGLDADVTDADDAHDAAPDGDEPDTTSIDYQVSFVSPAARTVFGAADNVQFVVQLSDGGVDAEGVALRIESSRDGVLGSGNSATDGTFTVSTSSLSNGQHTITAIVTDDRGSGTATLAIGVCRWGAAFPFDTDLDAATWTSVGNAYRDERGWLEMTGDAQSRKGAIVNIGEPVAPGDVRMRFRISTGHCTDPGSCSNFSEGADGFAYSILAFETAAEAVTYMEDALNGGGLGYARSSAQQSLAVETFHVEFDTYFNNDQNGGIADPTSTNHIAVTLNGDARNHVLWSEAANLEDNNWHDIEIEIVGSRVVIRYDGVVVIDDVSPGLEFKGGFIAFSGTTGYFSNHHRFDALEIAESCLFQ